MTTPAGSTILADIGGTNARFALLAGGNVGPSASYAVADYASPVEATRAFLAGPAAGHAPKRALIAAAGPVVNGRITLTNAPWTVDGGRIRRELDLEDVRVLNDFEALGWALPALRAEDILTLGVCGPAGHGTMAVMGPGSGFGLAALALGPSGETVLVTEGGHATLPSENRREDAIIVALREQLHHVSIEHVLSGPGLVQLYHAIARVDGLTVPGRSSSEIVSHALAGDCQVSRETLELFCAFLGSTAGNVALTLGARGGVFIGGGIALHFTEFLRRSAFRERFEAKGRMAGYLARIPTAIIVHPTPAFLGLAYLARKAAHRTSS
jgi:glucokinase